MGHFSSECVFSSLRSEQCGGTCHIGMVVNSTCQLTCVNNVSDAWSDLLLDVSVESIFYERNIYKDFLTNEVFAFYHELFLYRKLTVCLKPKCSPNAKYKVHLC